MVRWEDLVVGEDPNVSGAWKDNHPSEKNFQGKSVKFTLHSHSTSYNSPKTSNWQNLHKMEINYDTQPTNF